MLVCLVASLMAQAPAEPAQPDTKKSEETVPEAPPAQEDQTIDFSAYPNVQEVVDDAFIALTQNNTSNGGFFVFFGANWCGHCRKFKPVFAELSESGSKRNETALKPAFIFHPVEKRNSHVPKLFRVKGYPTLIYLRQNSWWEYNGDRNATRILEWLDQLIANGTTGKPYPERLPTFSEEFVEHWDEFKHMVYFQYTYHPIMFFFILGALIVFVIMCVSTCAQLASDDSGDYTPNAAAQIDIQKRKAAKVLEQSKKDK